MPCIPSCDYYLKAVFTLLRASDSVATIWRQHLFEEIRQLLKPFEPHSALLVTSHCALHRNDSPCMLARKFLVSRKGGAGRGGWGHWQGDMQMAATRLGCKRAMVCTEWANIPPWLHKQAQKRLLSPFWRFISGRDGGLGTEQVFANKTGWLLLAH